MAKLDMNMDSRGRTIDDEILATEHVENHSPVCKQFVKTIGRLWHSKRRFSWATRFELQGDMSVRTFDDCRFEPVRQFA